MKKLLLTSIAALSVLASAAHARPHINLLPPPQYDKQYDGELEMQRISTQEEIDRICKGTSHYACTLRSHNGKRCWIFIATDDVLKSQGMHYAFALRHELAHCNGWNHPPPNALKGKHFQAGDTWNEAEGAKWIVIEHFRIMPIFTRANANTPNLSWSCLRDARLEPELCAKRQEGAWAYSRSF